MSFPLTPLHEVADINPSLGVRLESDDHVSFLPMSAVDANLVDAVDDESRPFHAVSKGYTPFIAEDVLVAKITPCFENGKIAHAKPRHGVGFGSTEFHVIRPHSDELDARYLVHFLRQERIRKDGEQRMTGSGGQRRVPEHFLANLEVPIPSLVEQRRIAEILDKADALRAKRRAALAQLDTLARSIFLNMFGDPATNPLGWPMQVIGNILQSASYGTSDKSDASGLMPVLRMNNITSSGRIDLDDLKFMKMSEADVDRYTVRAGDVLFNRTNSAELVGKTAIFREPRPMAYAGYLIRLRVNDENDPDYLAGFLNTAYAKRVLRGMCKSIIGMANINATELQKIRIAKVPLEIQQGFARAIAFIEQLRSAQFASLTQIDALFASLQHRAFCGEL